MSTMRIAPAAVAALAVLAACQAPAPMRSQVTAAPASPVEGEWNSADGVAVSRFTGGAFETRATDTGNVLANGSYRFVDNRTVSIAVTSLIRNTTSNVNCALATQSQLNCTSSTGQQFVLTRRSRV